MQEVVGIGVLGKLARHGADDRQLIGDSAEVGKEIADRNAALAILAKGPQAGEERADIVELRGLNLEERAWILAGVALQPRLGVKRVDLRHAAVHI